MAQSSFDNKIKQFEASSADQFSSKELSRSYWIVTHKILLRNLMIMALIAIDAILIVYAVFQFGSYLFAGSPREDALVIALAKRLQISSVNRLQATAPTPLVLGSAQTFDGGNGTVDFAAEVQNTNANWYATVHFNFTLDGDKTTDTQTTFVIPGEHKYLLALGQKNTSVLTSTSLQVVDISWTRIDPHVVADIPNFIKSHATFDITGATFTPQGVISAGAVDTNPGNQITFSISNRTAFNFYEVPLQILLMRGGNVIGFEYITVKDFKTFETRQIDLRNYVTGMTVDDIQIIPTVDVFDNNVYVSQ